MNKKAQKLFFGFGMAVMLFLALTQIISPMKDTVLTARNSTNLNCSGSGLTTGVRATCVMVDWAPFYFFISGLAVAIGFLTSKAIKQS